MGAHAIVIGINRYAKPEWCLSGAVGDAVKFARWALDHGQVAPKHLTLLLSPLDDDDPVDDAQLAALAGPATWDAVSKALFRYQNGAGADAERFWFYYAGHGLAPPGSAPDAGPLIVPADVDDLDFYIATRAIGLETFRGAMQNTPPAEQFFFVDACRDVLPVKANKILTHQLLWDLHGIDDSALSTQAVFLATTAGQKAKELRSKGIFSTALVAALRGLGPELEEPESPLGEPHMRLLFNPLVHFVIDAVRRSLEELAPDDAAARKAIPYARVNRITGDIRIAEFPVAALPQASIGAIVEPPPARKDGRIEFLQWDKGKKKWVVCDDPPPVAPELPEQVDFRLGGGKHFMRVQASGYEPVTRELLVYKDSRIRIRLQPAPAAAMPAAPAAAPAAPEFELEAIVFRSGLESLEPQPASELDSVGNPIEDFVENVPATGTLVAECPDALVRLAIFDGGGNERARGYGSVRASELAPGPYRVTAELTAGDRVERTVTVRAGETESVRLDVAFTRPDPVVQAMLERNDINVHDGYAQPAESLGPVAHLRLGSLLAYAAWGARWRDAMHHLRALGVDPLPDLRPDQSALQVLLADAQADEQALGACRVHVGEDEVAMTPLERIPIAVQGSAVLPAGPARVRVRMTGFAPATFAVVLLPGLVTILVVAREADGDIEVQQHLNPIDPTRSLLPDCDPPRPDDVRVVELAARALENREPLDSVELGGLITAKRGNPMLGVIAGYRMLGTARAEQFRRPLQNMLRAFDGLPDLHVLAGLYEPAQRDEHFDRAMQRGTPVIAQGFWTLLQWLTARAVATNMPPPALRESVLPGIVWTAFSEPSVAARADALRIITPGGQTRFGDSGRNEPVARAAEAVGLIEGNDMPVGTCVVIAPRIVLCPSFVTEHARRVHFGEVTRDVARVLRMLPGTQPENYALALLELAEDAPVPPLRIADAAPGVGQAVAVIAFPFEEMRYHVAFSEHFAGASGEKHVMWGAVVRAPDASGTFDHDCFTSVGTAGSPVIDPATGLAVGMHVAGMPPSNGRKRGIAVSLAPFAKAIEEALKG